MTLQPLSAFVQEYITKNYPEALSADRFLSLKAYIEKCLKDNEAIVNAFYHRDYMCHEPVQIEIEPDHIQITSFPGIDRSSSLSVVMLQV